MENMRKRIKIRVVKNAKGFIKYTSRPTCVYWKVIENNLAAIHEKKISLTLNKPIYVGFTILEISKSEMYNFHYNSMIRNLTLDYYLQTQTVYVMNFMNKIHKIMYKYKDLFDLNNFLVSSKYYCSDK